MCPLRDAAQGMGTGHHGELSSRGTYRESQATEGFYARTKVGLEAGQGFTHP